MLLLLPADGPGDDQLPESYRPFHKGHVSISTGLYIREDEDIVVPGTPPLILRRTYLSNYHAPKQFGVGTTHAGEWYLVGDGERFAWAALILADGARVQFDRVSPGTSFFNAMYEHHSTPSEWQGARLAWTWGTWTLRPLDGSLARFLTCGPSSVCSLLETRDSAGHAVQYRRSWSGRLLRMEASADRWIAFAYDTEDRITRASSSTGDWVDYVYDAGGRLSGVTSSDGTKRRYTYTDRDLMATIDDPGRTIENFYDDDGRCVRQVNRYPGDDEPFTFTFTYGIADKAVVEATSAQSDGDWARYTFNKDRYTTSETWGGTDVGPATILYERDQVTNLVTGLTVTCPDRTGRPLQHTSVVKPGWEDWTKWDLLQTHCSWRKRPQADVTDMSLLPMSSSVPVKSRR